MLALITAVIRASAAAYAAMKAALCVVLNSMRRFRQYCAPFLQDYVRLSFKNTAKISSVDGGLTVSDYLEEGCVVLTKVQIELPVEHLGFRPIHLVYSKCHKQTPWRSVPFLYVFLFNATVVRPKLQRQLSVFPHIQSTPKGKRLAPKSAKPSSVGIFFFFFVSTLFFLDLSEGDSNCSETSVYYRFQRV